MAKINMTGKDLLLLLLYAPGTTRKSNEPIRGRTRLMKLIFIFEREIYKVFEFDRIIAEDNLPGFLKYYFGPFSHDVFNDIEFFKQIRFIQVTTDEKSDVTPEEEEEYRWWEDNISLPINDISQYTEEIFELSDKGMKYVETEKLYASLSEKQRNILQEYKKKFNSAPLYAILQYVYKKYPEMAERSKIKDKYSY